MSDGATVQHLRAEDLLDDREPPARLVRGGVSRSRRLAGLGLAVVVLPLLTLLLDVTRTSFTTESVALIYLLAVVALAAIGGTATGVMSAVTAVLLTTYFFVEPRHTFKIAREDQAVALVVFLVVALVVSVAIDLAARRTRAATHAVEQARALSELGAGRLDAESTLGDVLDHARRTFDMETVTLRARDSFDDDWLDVERSGWAARGREAPVRFDVPVTPRLRLVGRGPAMFAEDQRVLDAFAAASRNAYEARRMSAAAKEAENIAVADRQRVGLLAAVGHDLRTPLAGIKASVSGLRQTDIELPMEERDELLATIEDSADRLERVVANLLDASRLEAGALAVQAEALALDAVVGAAVLGVPGASARVRVDVPDDLPLVLADAGLLERVLANLVDNAIRHGGGTPVVIQGLATTTKAKVEVIDRGPGVDSRQRSAMFAPFQRRDDRGSGLGLGLAVSRGFVEAMGGSLIADGSDGRGLTMRLTLPLAGADPS